MVSEISILQLLTEGQVNICPTPKRGKILEIVAHIKKLLQSQIFAPRSNGTTSISAKAYSR